MRLSDNGRCFVCGPKNPIGLHLHFRVEGEEYVTDFQPDENHQGFFGIVHGGILSAVLDEVMARHLWVQGTPAVTAELRVTLKEPLRVGEAVRVSSRVARERGRLILCEAQACRPDGTVVATAEGKLFRVSVE